MKSPKLALIAITLAALLTACSGGGGNTTAPSDSTTGGTDGGTTTTTTDGTTTTLVTTTCTPSPALPSQYSRVFKGCDSAGVAQYYDLTECVRDNTTGLIWQGQTNTGSDLRYRGRVLNNYDSTSGNQNYNSGVPTSVSDFQINDLTNSIGFKNAVNATNLCGSNAWRLPTIDELLGLVKSTELPKIDNAAFPNTQGYFYATSTPSTTAAYLVWVVNFNTGTSSQNYRNNGGGGNGALVRLVR
ncbi:MAG: DUF1566 domain-containing protein [Polaromonas sp.]|jgi:hypothetical protein|nr:DUF1566 domain-containing protein [Polaromonas sp.]MBP6142080.1 DUF1566 domain-containing protein [Polaromonas sp.]MBP6156243.1 DUF1566 domain-containing protein [Polaromonas sp.]MBP7115765.1 DUF1566 domain-containing protein [Polaromonas sp.]MBP7307961.1 DUF1566 domain-containing protein [Polaromonas sp.]